jgi:hypothetical protein
MIINQKIEDQIIKKNHKPGLNNEIKNHQNFDKMPRKK